MEKNLFSTNEKKKDAPVQLITYHAFNEHEFMPREMAHQGRALAALPEDLSSVPAPTSCGSQWPVTLAPGDLMMSLDLHWHLYSQQIPTLI